MMESRYFLLTKKQMLPQIPEKLIYQNIHCDLPIEQPLESWFEMKGNRPAFYVPHTALWRGYVGTWQINSQGKLFLVELEGMLENGNIIHLETLFPEAKDGVFAEWYSGTFSLPQGELQNAICIGYSSVYEQYLVLTIEKGRLIASHYETNDDATQYGLGV